MVTDAQADKEQERAEAMMDAIERAKYLIKAANEAEEQADYVATVQEAHAVAAIAQAEQLKRVADCLNALVDAARGIEDALYRNALEWGKDTDEEAEARTDYADPLN